MRSIRTIGFLAAALLILAPETRAAAGSLYDDLGGTPGIDMIVDQAVDLWLADPRVKDDFDNINLDRLRTRIKSQLCDLTDGPCHYTGHSMQAAHKGLDVTQAKFNAVAEDLRTAMVRCRIGYWTQNRLLARLAPMERPMVAR